VVRYFDTSHTTDCKVFLGMLSIQFLSSLEIYARAYRGNVFVAVFNMCKVISSGNITLRNLEVS